MPTEERDLFDDALEEALNLCNEAFIPIQQLRPALLARGLSEDDFAELKRRRRSGSSNHSCSEAKRLLGEIYQDAALRNLAEVAVQIPEDERNKP